MRKIALAVGFWLLVMLAASWADAQRLYRWVDSEGRVHMTDDPNVLPQGSRPDSLPMPRGTARVARPSGLEELQLECDAAQEWARFVAMSDGRPPLLPRHLRVRCEELEREQVRRQMRRP